MEHALDFRDEQKGYRGGADKVDEEDKPYAIVEPQPRSLQGRHGSEEFRQQDEAHHVKDDVGDYEGEFQRDEPKGPALLPEAAEHDCLEGVLGHYYRHAADIFRVG